VIEPGKTNAPVGAVPAPTFASVSEDATASEGVLLEFVTVGTSHAGQLPEGAAKEETPLPPPPTSVHVPARHWYSLSVVLVA
jgi:hypothetical protein